MHPHVVAALEVLSLMLEVKANRERLFKRRYGDHIAKVVNALKRADEPIWKTLHEEAISHFGQESDYVQEFVRGQASY